MPTSPKQVARIVAKEVVGEHVAPESEVARPKNKQVVKVYTPSQRAQALEMLAVECPAQTSRKLGMSRFSLYEWARKQRALSEGQASDSPLVGSDEDTASARDAKILNEWKRPPGLGSSLRPSTANAVHDIGLAPGRERVREGPRRSKTRLASPWREQRANRAKRVIDE